MREQLDLQNEETVDIPAEQERIPSQDATQQNTVRECNLVDIADTLTATAENHASSSAFDIRLYHLDF